jgi:hypothetical protein
VKDLMEEVLSIVEGDVNWLDRAAEHFESFASRTDGAEKPTLELLTAVYRERAGFQQALAEKMRRQMQLTQPDISDEHSPDLVPG